MSSFGNSCMVLFGSVSRDRKTAAIRKPCLISVIHVCVHHYLSWHSAALFLDHPLSCRSVWLHLYSTKALVLHDLFNLICEKIDLNLPLGELPGKIYHVQCLKL